MLIFTFQVSPVSAGVVLSRSTLSFGGFVPSKCSEMISRAKKDSGTSRMVQLAGRKY